jgi:hypothetical protein
MMAKTPLLIIYQQTMWLAAFGFLRLIWVADWLWNNPQAVPTTT